MHFKLLANKKLLKFFSIIVIATLLCTSAAYLYSQDNMKSAEAPDWSVGEQWLYKITDTQRAKILWYEVDCVINSSYSSTIASKVYGFRANSVIQQNTQMLTFATLCPKYYLWIEFPLYDGKTKMVPGSHGEFYEIQVSKQKVQVEAGTFDTFNTSIIIHLGDKSLVYASNYYSPMVRNIVLLCLWWENIRVELTKHDSTDVDADGLADAIEDALGFDKKVADGDIDGVPDGWDTNPKIDLNQSIGITYFECYHENYHEKMIDPGTPPDVYFELVSNYKGKSVSNVTPVNWNKWTFECDYLFEVDLDDNNSHREMWSGNVFAYDKDRRPIDNADAIDINPSPYSSNVTILIMPWYPCRSTNFESAGDGKVSGFVKGYLKYNTDYKFQNIDNDEVGYDVGSYISTLSIINDFDYSKFPKITDVISLILES